MMNHLREYGGIDIVIVSDNNLATLQECLEGLFCSTSGMVNIIIVDQASTDGSKEYLQKKRVSHLILNSYNTGIAEGKNQGIVVGRYEWICLLNPTLRIVDPLWLDKMWDCTFERGVGVVEGVAQQAGKLFYAGLEFCLISRRCLMEVGLFDRSLSKNGENADLLTRIEWAGYKTAYCPDAQARYLLKDRERLSPEFLLKYESIKLKWTENITRRYQQNVELNKRGEKKNVF